MPAAAILGAQWGDEGKGKLVDLMAASADFVVRYQGGPNAGHTIKLEQGPSGEPLKVVLHHVPSGLLHDETRAVMGRGMVIDPTTLLDEIAALRAAGYEVTPERLLLSWDAHIVLPIHRAIDRAREESLGRAQIGTTLRGVGPTYEDRTARRGLRFRDLRDRDALPERLERLLSERNVLLEAYGAEPLDLDDELAAIDVWREQILDFGADTNETVRRALAGGQRVLAEGAQGALLDLSLGTYPFVTSSHTTTAGIFVGSGVGPRHLGSVMGVTKAYTTRVGAGPFPSELHDERGRHLAQRGHEFGATTGRPRRCGWLDLVALRYAIDVCGITQLAMTKLDVLGGLEKIGLVTAYDTPKGRRNDYPDDPSELAATKPVVEELAGWDDEISNRRSLEALPATCRALIDRVVEAVETPVTVVSVGPTRSQSLVLSELWS